MHEQPEKTENVRSALFPEEICCRQQHIHAVNLLANAENDGENTQPTIDHNNEPPNVHEQPGKQAVNAYLQAKMAGQQVEK